MQQRSKQETTGRKSGHTRQKAAKQETAKNIQQHQFLDPKVSLLFRQTLADPMYIFSGTCLHVAQHW